jgi:hypothetical protein
LAKSFISDSQFNVHEALKQHLGIERSKYLKAAMEVLRIPLRQDRAIPWNIINDLEPLRTVMGQTDFNDKKGKRRRVEQETQKDASQHRSLKGTEKKRRVAIEKPKSKDCGEDIRVKVEEAHFEVWIILYAAILAYNKSDSLREHARKAKPITPPSTPLPGVTQRPFGPGDKHYHRVRFFPHNNTKV